MKSAQEIANILSGTEYPVRLSRELELAAKESGLVIVFGASDDLMEFRGGIHDEVDAYEGTVVEVGQNGLLPSYESLDKDDIKAMRAYFLSEGKGRSIEAVWEEDGYSFQYRTDIPHATFEVVEDGDKYCKGIVFRLQDCAA